MSRLPNSITPSLKLLTCFQSSASAMRNIRHFGSFCTPKGIVARKVGLTKLSHLNNKPCCGCVVRSGYGSKIYVRTISSSLRCYKNAEESEEVRDVTEAPKKSEVPLGDYIKPNLRQKRMLVWSKKYPSVAEVPEYVHVSKMTSATNIFRIKANLATMVLFLITSYIAIKISQYQRGKYIVKRQQEADDYQDMLDSYEAEKKKEKSQQQ